MVSFHGVGRLVRERKYISGSGSEGAARTNVRRQEDFCGLSKVDR